MHRTVERKVVIVIGSVAHLVGRPGAEVQGEEQGAHAWVSPDKGVVIEGEVLPPGTQRRRPLKA
jgi:hypothetical protein